MPGQSGVALTRRLLALRPQLPVLVMHSHSSEGLEQRMRTARARGLVHMPPSANRRAQTAERKPPSANELAEAVACFLPPT